MKSNILLLVALLLAAALPSSAEDKPFDFNRAKELYAKSQRGESLTQDEQSFLEEAKRQFQQRTGMSEEQIEKIRALHEKSRRGENLTADEQKLLDAAKARAGQGDAPASKDSFDWDKAKALHERAQRGESLNADEQKFYEEAKRRFQNGQGPGARPNDGIDMQRARGIYERKQKGESISAEDEKYLAEAMKRRGGEGGGSGRRSEGGPAGQTVTDAAVLKELVPLTELTGNYKGQDGGLYGGGKNEPPADLQARATKAAAQVGPLNAEGKPDASGKIVLLSIGMSNTTMEFSQFVQKANADPRKAANVVVVDGAQGGKDATAWATADAQPWKVVEDRMKQAGVTPRQVQVIWIKQALIRPQAGFPAETDRLHDRIAEDLKLAKEKYPNLRLVFLSSRTYGGFATTPLNPEPYAYESAFAVRRLIQEQATDATSPVLLWGPYVWASGKTPNKADGFNYTPEDVAGDGTHPSPSGRDKVAVQLLNFFTSNPNAKPWFVKKE
jgi:hypothetical protein